MKNMSKDRLNIDADELMEGQFDITVDGDLFKVSIALKKAEGTAA